MNDKSKKKANLPLILGSVGFLAGIALAFGENKMIGIFGAIASAGLAYSGYKEMNK